MYFVKRVRFGEVDSQGVLYHGRYLDYFDIGVQEYWRAASGGGSIVTATYGHFHVVRAEVVYLRPIVMDELIDIVVRVEKIGRSSITYAVEVRANGDGEVRARGSLIHVQVDAHKGRSIPVDSRNVAMIETCERGSQE